ncbi:SOAT1 [Bugula neritina]|uniref:O-acyltransferase n=1 Tax=Bugula neritina TaxID=10212 RepID=A0A7J7JXI9_BUGNE|nr:SOAT1 [Bugula neritina]
MEDIGSLGTSVRQRLTCKEFEENDSLSASKPSTNELRSEDSTEDEHSTSTLAQEASPMESSHRQHRQTPDLFVTSRLNVISKEVNVAYGQLQEKFSIEYRNLLESAINSASRIQTGYDSSVADRVSFSFSSSKTEDRITKKRFTTRESVLTELLRTNHIKTVHNIFAAILIIFSVQTVVYDLIEQGSLISWGFGKFSLVISIWLCMLTSTISIFPIFNMWRQLRPSSTKLLDRAFLLFYIAYLAAFLCVPVWALAEYDLPPVSTLVVAIEQVRLLMKAHSFVRENAPRVLHADKTIDDGLNFSRYLYFLFAPTLIYKDEYPRTSAINWNTVVYNVSELVICIFYIYYIFVRFCIPNFHNFNSDHVTIKMFVYSVFGCMMPGTLVLLIGFYAILHCWLNACAEMLRFGDRLFYKDWWNSVNFSGYYRNWNIVVHDWLFTYIYQDTYMLLKFQKHMRWLAMYTTFFISAVFHEYIIILAFRFVYPVLFVLFAIIGVGFIYVTTGHNKRTSNIFLWVALFIGNGILMCLYSMEYFSRRNCPLIKDSFLDYMIPRSWFCTPNE